MPKRVSATEAKVHLGAIMDWAVKHGDEVIIETRGRAKAVIISFEEYQRFQELEIIARRQEALERLETLAEQLGSHNRDLTQGVADELADRFGKEVIDEMIREG